MARNQRSPWVRLRRNVAAWIGAALATLAVFCVLPLMQTIGSGGGPDLDLRSLDVSQLPPPPPPPPPEPEPEEQEQDEPPPELVEQTAPLDLAQLELALDPVGGGALFGDFTVSLARQIAGGDGGDAVDRIFALGELDQQPRLLFQKPPSYPAELYRAGREGTVHVVFLVDTDGRVQNAVVQRSSDPAFESAALDAVREWRFEPGTRKGKRVQFKMLQPISFKR